MKRTFCAVLGAMIALGFGASALGQTDQNPAMNAPDETAWKLFLEVSTNAGGSYGPALFETWASDSDTFKPNPVFPSGPTQLSLHPRALLMVEREEAQINHKALPAIPPGGGALEESRRNRSAFEFIVKHDLYRISGLQKAFGQTFTFPIDSIEVKANWIPVSDVYKLTTYKGLPADVPKFFHVNVNQADKKQYAMVAMHIISKSVPNWTWATFESQFNPARCDILGCQDSFGSQTAHVDPNKQPEQGYPDCTKSAALSKLFSQAKLDAAFDNYCLKGSQVDFIDNTGLAVRLGNSITEAGFVESASCMTCHGRAAWDAKGKMTSPAGFVDPVKPVGPLGSLNPAWAWKFSVSPPIYQGMAGLTQTGTSADFVWSIPLCAYDDATDPKNPKKSRCTGK